jgi:hypothetical protein
MITVRDGKTYWTVALLLAAIAILSLSESAFADWGYDETPQQAPATESKEEEALPPQLVAPKAGRLLVPAQKAPLAKGKTGSTGTPAKPGASPQATKAVSQSDIKIATAQWLDLYSLVADRELTEEEESTLTNYLTETITKGKKPNQPNLLGILRFWPQVKSTIAESAIQKDNYRALFHALLRLQLSAKQMLKVKPSASGEEDQSDSKNSPGKMVITKVNQGEEMGLAEQGEEAISCLLGPQRIAKPGSPPLTEDAINAYADMACFLYEQKNPGKTVDANDNRTLFAEAISYKYDEAPTASDRAAMASFDLTWSIFKIEWESADEAGRKQLLQHLGKKKTDAASSIAEDPVLNCVLINGPWKSLVSG